MATITGDPSQYPLEYYKPSDASPPKALEVNPALEALGDRTAYLKQFTGQIPAINFPIHPEQSSVGEMHWAVYSPKYLRWWVVGSTGNVRSSSDGGHSWPITSEIASVADDEDCLGIDLDPNGNAVVTTDSPYIFELTASTNTWTKQDLSFLSSSGSMRVVHDPVHDKWVIFSKNAGSPEVNTSTNRTSWSMGGTPSGFSTVNNYDMAVNKTTGRIVLVALNSGGDAEIRTSDDAGTSWTARDDVSFGIAPIDNLAIVRDTNVAERWLLIANRTTGGFNTEVWESTDDGSNFTRIHQNVFHSLYRCASVAGMLVGVTNHPAINRYATVFSLDGGASWTPTGMCVGGSMRGVFAGEGGVAVVTSSDIYLGARVGLPSFASFT